MFPERNLEQAEIFLRALDADAAAEFTFQTFPERPRGPKAPPQTIQATFAAATDRLIEANDKGAAVCATINRTDGRGRRATNVIDIRAIFLDLDGAPLDPVLSAELTPDMVIESSPGKYHAYYPTTDFPLSDFRLAQGALARRFSGDPNVCDRPRAMRLPGFLHQKDRPYRTWICDGPHGRRYSAATLFKWLEIRHSPDHSAPPLSATQSGATPSLLLVPGSRNNTLFALASRLHRERVSFDDIVSTVLRANRTSSVPLCDDEVMRLVRSACKYGARKQFTDLGNAYRMQAMYGDDLRHLPEVDRFLHWSGDEKRWLFDRDGITVRCAILTVKSYYIEAAESNHEVATSICKHAVRSESKQRLDAMVQIYKSLDGISVCPDQLDSDQYLLGVQNGVIDLRHGNLIAPTREMFITKRAHVSYDPTATAPRFEDFIDEITSGNSEIAAYLQRLAGYCLTGDTNEQSLHFFYGTGANGKSVLLEVLRRLLGDYAVQAQADSLMQRRDIGSPRNDLARLKGARLVIASEIEDGQPMAEGLVKQLTGQDRIVARHLYKEHFEFTPQFKIIVAANHRPQILGDDYAIWRRIRLVPFEVTIPEDRRDPQLVDKLAAELAGILNWALRGLLEWHRAGLQPPQAVLLATSEYRREMDILGDWLQECCTTDDRNAEWPVGALYQSYASYCRERALPIISTPKFSRRLKERGFHKSRSRQARKFIGLSLRGEGGLPVPPPGKLVIGGRLIEIDPSDGCDG
jgi:putative DNA primase/helicase